jgi:hypothetical protein
VGEVTDFRSSGRLVGVAKQIRDWEQAASLFSNLPFIILVSQRSHQLRQLFRGVRLQAGNKSVVEEHLGQPG